MGSVHANALAALESIEVVAVADPSTDARAAAALLFPTARLLAEPADAFELAGVEACLLATPTPLHPAQVRAALAAGLHVLCEKPLSLDPAESLDIDHAATRAGRVLQLGFWRRYAPPWRAAKDALEADRIGVPLTCGWLNGMPTRRLRRSAILVSVVGWRSTAVCTNTTSPNG